MHEVRLGEKGQVTLPKKIRDRYRLSKGDQVRMIDLGNGIMEVILLEYSRELPPPRPPLTGTSGAAKRDRNR